MKISFLLTGLDFVGGCEIQTGMLAERLAKRHKVTVFTRKFGDHKTKERRKGFDVVRFRFIDIPVIRYFSHIMSFLWNFRKHVRETDILCCMYSTPNGLAGVLAKKLFGVPMITSIRGCRDPAFTGGFFYTRLVRFVFRNSDTVTVQTKSLKNILDEKFPGTNIKIVPNGVYFSKRKASGEKVVFAGNLHEHKGIEYLIEAARLGDFSLLIIGDGLEREKLESMSKGLDVKFVGNVEHDKVKDYMSMGSVFVLPSVKGEGMPNAVLEAMSVGLPVVATDLNSISDIVVRGKTGLIVPIRDSAALGRAIKRLLENKGLREQMSRNALKEVKKYSWESVVKRFEEILGAIDIRHGS